MDSDIKRVKTKVIGMILNCPYNQENDSSSDEEELSPAAIQEHFFNIAKKQVNIVIVSNNLNDQV
jgi:hypothetical protein